MAKILKPYEVPLDAALAAEILKIPLEETATSPPPTTIEERVRRAVEAIEQANHYLADSALAALVADTLMRKLKKRGVPTIRVRPDGVVILHVSYDDAEALRPKAPPAAVARSARESDLPKLVDLRKMARRLKVDISDLGQKRRAIHERLEDAKDAKASSFSQNDPQPPTRLADEPTESEAPPRSRVIRRRKNVDGVVEELDVDPLLR